MQQWSAQGIGKTVEFDTGLIDSADNNPSSGNVNGLGSAQNVSVSAEVVPAAVVVGDWIQPEERGESLLVWLQNSEGQKGKGRDIQPSRWVFPEISPTDTFIMIALRVAFFSCHFFNCCLLGFLRFRRLSRVFTSAPNLPPNYRAWRSNSASFHLKSVFIWIQFSAEAKAEPWSLLDH